MEEEEEGKKEEEEEVVVGEDTPMANKFMAHVSPSQVVTATSRRTKTATALTQIGSAVSEEMVREEEQ